MRHSHQHWQLAGDERSNLLTFRSWAKPKIGRHTHSPKGLNFGSACRERYSSRWPTADAARPFRSSFASSVISALRTLETGQFFSASFAKLANLASSRLGTLARSVRAERLMRNPLPSGSRVTAASVLSSVGVKPAALQAKGERHGEAPGVRCGNQLLGIGALLVLKAGLEGIRRAGEHSGVGGKIAAAIAARAAPNRFRLADHEGLLFCKRCHVEDAMRTPRVSILSPLQTV